MYGGLDFSEPQDKFCDRLQANLFRNLMIAYVNF